MSAPQRLRSAIPDGHLHEQMLQQCSRPAFWTRSWRRSETTAGRLCVHVCSQDWVQHQAGCLHEAGGSSLQRKALPVLVSSSVVCAAMRPTCSTRRWVRCTRHHGELPRCTCRCCATSTVWYFWCNGTSSGCFCAGTCSSRKQMVEGLVLHRRGMPPPRSSTATHRGRQMQTMSVLRAAAARSCPGRRPKLRARGR